MKLVSCLSLIALAALLMGGACLLPLADNTQRTAEPGRRLAVSIDEPASDETVGQGQPLTVRWSAANLTGQLADVQIFAESRATLERFTIAELIPADNVSNSGTVQWDTTGRSGEFALIATLITTAETITATSGVRVRVRAAPSFTFTAPTTSQNVRAGSTVTISWTGSGVGASAELLLDPDTSHDSGNEILINRAMLPEAADASTFSFLGSDGEGEPVPAGSYNLFARVRDGVNATFDIDSPARITLRANNGDLIIAAPVTDTEFLTSAASLDLRYTVEKPAETLVDLIIDTDDNHANGNEITILSQQVIAGNTIDPQTFAWNGDAADGAPVDPGLYRLVLSVSTGAATPEQADGAGLILRRTDSALPLIALLEPAGQTTVAPGAFVTVRWRDDAPSAATVRITLDDDINPAEAIETDADEVQVLAGRAATGDGVQDTFSLQVPATLPPGTYFVFAYIDRDGAPPFDHISTAGGRIIVPDPAAP